MSEQRIDADHAAGQDLPKTLEGEIAHRAARHQGTGGFCRSASPEGHVGERHGLRAVERRRLLGRDPEAGDFCCVTGSAAALAASAATNEVPATGRQRVVRRHHQETHMVDDVLGREQRVASSHGWRGTVARTGVLAALGAADRYLLRRNRRRWLRPARRAPSCGAGQRLADHGNRSRHHVDEGAGDLVDLGADAGAEKLRQGRANETLSPDKTTPSPPAAPSCRATRAAMPVSGSAR